MSSGRVVAELGRPETPEETLARKERESRLYRERKTLSNLIYALISTLALVVVIVLAVPHPNTQVNFSVDPTAVAAGVAPGLGSTPIVPALDWTANAAELRTSADGVTAWYIGWVAADSEYLGMFQAISANPSWVSSQVADTPPTGSRSLAGLDWVVYDNRDRSTDVGNARYALATTLTAPDGTEQTILLLGTADDTQFTAAATAIAEAIRALN
ncbi:MAG: DUF4245 family protein [Agromyces sp.]